MEHRRLLHVIFTFDNVTYTNACLDFRSTNLVSLEFVMYTRDTAVILTNAFPSYMYNVCVYIRGPKQGGGWGGCNPPPP